MKHSTQTSPQLLITNGRSSTCGHIYAPHLSSSSLFFWISIASFRKMMDIKIRSWHLPLSSLMYYYSFSQSWITFSKFTTSDHFRHKMICRSYFWSLEILCTWSIMDKSWERMNWSNKVIQTKKLIMLSSQSCWVSPCSCWTCESFRLWAIFLLNLEEHLQSLPKQHQT